MTPYSTRKLKQVTFSFYSGCKLANDEGLTVQGIDSISTFQPQQIPGSDVTFSSDSKSLADLHANLTVRFKPKTVMKASGQLSIQVPGWYVTQRSNFQDQPDVFSAQSHLDEDSVPTITSPLGVTVKSFRFNQANRTLQVSYSASADIVGQVTVVVSNFKNPVNQRAKSGFSITTLDESGYLINSSDGDLPLIAELTQVASSGDREMSMLGDASGNNIGRIGTYQQISLYINSYIPFEQGCFWKFQFPAMLKLDDQLTTVIGDGIFKPKNSGGYLSSDEFRVDLKTNTVTV